MLESDDDEAEEEEALDDEVKEKAILLGVRLKRRAGGIIRSAMISERSRAGDPNNIILVAHLLG